MSKITVVIPTYNRAALLRISLASAIGQDYPDFQVVVLDNASTDDTETIVHTFSDSRLSYLRSDTNIGMFRNWNRAIEVNTSPYLCIHQDDNVMLPGFLRESIRILEKYHSAGFSFTAARAIDIEGKPLHLFNLAGLPEEGVINGLDFLHQIVAGQTWFIRDSTVMMRSSALALVGPFDNSHSTHSTDLNLFYRLAAKFDIAFFQKELMHIRVHAGQDTRLRFNSPGGTGKLAQMAERTDAIAYLMQSVRAEDLSYRSWLAERLLFTNMWRSELTAELVPSLNLSWRERLVIAKEEIARLIPTGASFILVDGNQWGSAVVESRHALPFLERDGHYWGAPAESAVAIRELERLRQSGMKFIIFGWPAFWWLDYYAAFRDYLYSHFPCVLKNSRLIAFDLTV